MPSSVLGRVIHVAGIVRIISLVCALTIIFASCAPWSEVEGTLSREPIVYLGIWRPEGQFSCMIGLIIFGFSVGRRKATRLVPDIAVLIAFSALVISSVRLYTDTARLARLPYGGIRFEGWEWTEPRWGLTLTLISSVVGLLATAVGVLHKIEGKLHIFSTAATPGADNHG